MTRSDAPPARRAAPAAEPVSERMLRLLADGLSRAYALPAALDLAVRTVLVPALPGPAAPLTGPAHGLAGLVPLTPAPAGGAPGLLLPLLLLLALLVLRWLVQGLGQQPAASARRMPGRDATRTPDHAAAQAGVTAPPAPSRQRRATARHTWRHAVGSCCPPPAMRPRGVATAQ